MPDTLRVQPILNIETTFEALITANAELNISNYISDEIEGTLGFILGGLKTGIGFSQEIPLYEFPSIEISPFKDSNDWQEIVLT